MDTKQQKSCCVQTEWVFIQEVKESKTKKKKVVINTPFKYKTNKK